MADEEKESTEETDETESAEAEETTEETAEAESPDDEAGETGESESAEAEEDDAEAVEAEEDEVSDGEPSDEESEEEVEEVASAMTEGEEEEEESRTKPVIKHEGEFYGTGRRKESVARVWIEAGEGAITVNEKPVDEYFNNRELWLQSLTSPLKTLDFEEDIDVWATADGGGLTGQADAVRLGIARALVDMDENARAWLRPEGHLTRDDRQVERKKINQPGARKKQQVSKR